MSRDIEKSDRTKTRSIRMGRHIVFGAVIPLLCLVFDPIVFSGRIEPTPLASFRVYVYTGFAIQFCALIFWFGGANRLLRFSGFFVGVFAVGAVGALVIGIVILPMSIVGLAIVVGVLGLCPFLAALAYYRNAVIALECARLAGAPRWQLWVGLGGIAIAAGVPIAAGATIAPYALESQLRNPSGGDTPVEFSWDGRRLASGHRDGSIRVWSTVDGAAVVAAASGDPVNAVVFCGDSGLVASGHESGRIRLWIARSGRLSGELLHHRGAVRALDYSLAGELASGGSDGAALIWDVRSGVARESARSRSCINAMSFSPSGTNLAIGSSDGTVRLSDVVGNRDDRVFVGHQGEVTALAFLSDEGFLVSGAGHFQSTTAVPDGEVILWAVESGSVERKWKMDYYPYVRSISVASGGRFAVGGWGETGRGRGDWFGVFLFDTASSDQPVSLGPQVVSPQSIGVYVAFSPDGRWLATGCENDVIQIWDPSRPGSLVFAFDPSATE